MQEPREGRRRPPASPGPAKAGPGAAGVIPGSRMTERRSPPLKGVLGITYVLGFYKDSLRILLGFYWDVRPLGAS